MPNLKLIAPIVCIGVGSVVGGAGTYFISKKLLEGVKISSEITVEEQEKVKVSSKELINEVLNNDKMLIELYINSFESFIKNKYASIGIEVNNINYEEVK
jgi:hypothetical protein